MSGDCEEILQELVEGNERFCAGEAEQDVDHKKARRKNLGGQEPKVMVLGCSDSRVPPEIIFDRGIGDIYTVRVAGNVVDDLVLGSIEYGVIHVGIKVVVVMGHSQCGAVMACCEGNMLEGCMGSVVNKLKKSFKKAKDMDGDVEENTCLNNVQNMVGKITLEGDGFEELIEEDELLICGAYYQMDSGKVEFLK